MDAEHEYNDANLIVVLYLLYRSLMSMFSIVQDGAYCCSSGLVKLLIWIPVYEN